jgi:hypothetical protein
MKPRNAVRRRVAVAWMITGITVLAAPGAEAQRWGRSAEPRSGVCFYRDANYRGDYFCVEAGNSIASLPGQMNDEISSIRTFGNAEVTIFQSDRFEGRSTRFENSVRNLTEEGWNDRLSSLRVGRGFGGGGNRNSGSNNSGFGGGGRFGGDPDRIVRRAYQDILNREPDEPGFRHYRSRIIDENWTEEQVRDALRNSPEYRDRNTMTRPRAEAIVRSAYLSVLEREPDPGSRAYVEKVLREGWTEQEVAAELRKSPEYRSRRQ